MSARIALTCIFRNDDDCEMADRMLSSFMPYVDGLYAVITGLSNEEKKQITALIAKYNGKYVCVDENSEPGLYSTDEKGVFFSHFADARNISFALADKDGGYDYYTWADVDDVLISGKELRTLADASLENKYTYVFCTYWYGVRVTSDSKISEEGVEIFHMRERLISPGKFKWRSRVHEVLVPLDDAYKSQDGAYDFNSKQGRYLTWAHLKQKSTVDNSVDRNRRILMIQLEEEKYKDPRTILALIRIYAESKTNDDECYKLCEKYLASSGWDEERAMVWLILSEIEERRGSISNALDACFEGLKEAPGVHMLYLRLSSLYAYSNQYKKSDKWLDIVSKMEPPKADSVIGTPMNIKHTMAVLLFHRAIRNQKIEEAKTWLERVIKYENKESDERLAILDEEIAKNNAAKAILTYATWLKNNKKNKEIQLLVDSFPDELGSEPFAQHISNDVREPTIWPDKSIAIYASFGAEHFEKWSGKSLDTGIGGSETAIIYLAQQFTAAGYSVTVFGDPREDAGIIDGVIYKPWYSFNWKDEYNTLILWRSPHLLDRNIKAKKIYMDLHDVASQLDWTEERMQKVSKVFFKSKYHRAMLPKLPEDKAVVISNGIGYE